MNRVTAKEVEETFRFWCKAVKGTASYDEIGGYQLGSQLGGYRVEKRMNKSGGLRDISPRLPAREMQEWLFAGINAVEELKENTSSQ